MNKRIKVKRIYEKVGREDGARVLVDRLWPRGMKKEDAKIDLWMKEIAPSTGLRKWFHRETGRWTEFKKKYFAELHINKKLCGELMRQGRVNITLLYSSKDEEHNHALALKEFLEKHFMP